MALTQAAAAPLWGAFFHSDQVAAVAAVTSGMLLLSTAAIVPNALLQRRFSSVRRAVVEPLTAVTYGACRHRCLRCRDGNLGPCPGHLLRVGRGLLAHLGPRALAGRGRDSPRSRCGGSWRASRATSSPAPRWSALCWWPPSPCSAASPGRPPSATSATRSGWRSSRARRPSTWARTSCCSGLRRHRRRGRTLSRRVPALAADALHRGDALEHHPAAPRRAPRRRAVRLAVGVRPGPPWPPSASTARASPSWTWRSRPSSPRAGRRSSRG